MPPDSLVLFSVFFFIFGLVLVLNWSVHCCLLMRLRRVCFHFDLIVDFGFGVTIMCVNGRILFCSLGCCDRVRVVGGRVILEFWMQ